MGHVISILCLLLSFFFLQHRWRVAGGREYSALEVRYMEGHTSDSRLIYFGELGSYLDKF